MDRLWQEARSVGALAYVLAESATRLEPEEALLAGLLHNIGAIPVLVHAEHHPALVASPAALERALAELQSDIGAAILDHWHFPAAFVEAARHGDDWFYECPEERPQLVDLVIVSRLHARISEGRNDGLPEFEQVPAYRRLGALELTASRSLKLLEAARSDWTNCSDFWRGSEHGFSRPPVSLSSTVLPGGRIPLQLFEPRYLDMLARCLREQQGFVVVLLREGQEVDSQAAFYDIGTYVQITDFQQLDNGLLGITAEGYGKLRSAAVGARPMASIWATLSVCPRNRRTPCRLLIRAGGGASRVAAASGGQQAGADG